MVSSIYSTSISSMYSTAARKGIAGLASGINTDELIEAMTAATRSKIAKLLQKQTMAGWKTEAYQSITSMLLDFKIKYMSPASLTSMRNASFYQSATITPTGPNAQAVSVTGSASASLSGFSVISIDALAATAAFTSTKPASQGEIKSKDISTAVTEGYAASKLEGGSISLKFNGVAYNIELRNVETDTADPQLNADKIVDAINRGIEAAGLAGKVGAEIDAGKVQLKVLTTGGDGIEIAGLTSNVRNSLGIYAGETGNETTPIVGGINLWEQAAADDTVTKMSFSEALSGKSITFNLDGTNKAITFDASEFGTYNDFGSISDVVSYLNDKLAGAFGYVAGTSDQKVFVTDNLDGTVSYKTTDSTAVLSLASSALGVTDWGGVLGIDLADANRLLLAKPLTETNLNSDAAAFFLDPDFVDGSKYEEITVNGTEFRIYNNKIVVMNDGKPGAKTYNFENGTAMRDVMNTINNSSAGVRVQYNSTTDNFSVTATESGSMGKVEITGALADAIFGAAPVNPASPAAGERRTKEGEDAVLTVSFDGGTTQAQITRSSNNFSLNGLNITLNSTFAPGAGQAITFTAKANTDAIMGAIKDMVYAYNDIIAKVNKELSTKPDRDFQPLTWDQRKELSQNEIDVWEAKTKEGLLFADSILASLATDIRYAFSMPVGESSLSQIGIRSSSEWQDNGKLIIDEDKLRQAIENDPEKVADLFTRTLTSGSTTPASQNAGVMARLDAVMSKYVNTVGTQKGLLIERAGHESSPLSLTNNAMYKEMAAYERDMKVLQSRLETEEARYAKQFTSLETYISQMNQQSSWLTQMFTNNQ
ncbi:MAG: flagellar filament capping protein FliD [Clostridiales bacterium]|nr:flagellar filament capping protein FliD [Clostridiales bacterium]